MTTTPTPAPEVEALIERLESIGDEHGAVEMTYASAAEAMRDAAAFIRSQAARIKELEAERDNAIATARSHAMEAKTANATIREAYQAITGSRGEPGNWRGAEPIKAVVAQRDRLASRVERLRGTLEQICDIHKRNFGHQTEKLADVYPIAQAALRETPNARD